METIALIVDFILKGKTMNNTEKYKNRCKYCGGKLVIEFIGNYGSVYELKKDGEPSKRRKRRILYDESNGDYMIYCWDCGRSQE